MKLPLVESVDGGVKVTVWRKETTSDVIKDDVKDDVKELTERQALIYNIIKDNDVKGDVITASALATRLSVYVRTIQRDLRELQKRGLICREGGRKGGKWIITTN